MLSVPLRYLSPPLWACIITVPDAAEPHYVVRFYKDSSSKRAWLLDMQGNKVPLQHQPVVFGSLAIVPIDKVLMSGGSWLHGDIKYAIELHDKLTDYRLTGLLLL